MGVSDRLSEAVEKEKMLALGSRNMLKSISKQKEAQQLQLQVLLIRFKGPTMIFNKRRLNS